MYGIALLQKDIKEARDCISEAIYLDMKALDQSIQAEKETQETAFTFNAGPGP